MTLQVCDSQGQLQMIPCLEVTNACQTLGVQLAPDGNSTAKYQYLKTTMTKWKQKMEQAHLTHNYAFFSLHSLVLWKLAYPLAVTNFTEPQCSEIRKPILNAGLPKIGCIRLMP